MLLKPEDIQNRFPFCNYAVDVPFASLFGQIERDPYDVPPFQRERVWTEEQAISFIEYLARGGMSGRELYFNRKNYSEKIIIVDGQQRLAAAIDFLNNKFPIFGNVYAKDLQLLCFTFELRFRFNVCNMQDDKEIVQWYLNLNTGGTLHTKEDIEKAKKYL